MKRFFIVTHFAAAIVVTGILFTLYVTVQQVHRTAADDPQLQMARDIDARISEGRSIEGLFPPDTVEISRSLGTFVTLFNEAGKPIRSTGLLNGRLPQLPAGVFDFSRKNKEDVFTWQPEPGVRMATVVVSTAKGFVAVGRSLREVEIRESHLTSMVLMAWVACLVVIAIHGLLQSRLRVT
jgi:hypothetical protein